ncbi:MAG: radical SAM protein [archaeon]
MKITLISTSTYPSDQGIRTISSCLKKAGHNVRLIFLTASEDYSKFYSKNVLAQLKDMCSDSVLIGFSSMASTAKRAEQVISYLKPLNIPIVWGGIHATLSPEECIAYVDIICRGEGEEAAVELANAIEKGKDITKIKNLWVRKGNKIYKNDVRPMIQNIDALPFVDYDLETQYVLENDNIIKFRERHLSGQIFFLTGRGCPFGCTYCSNRFLNNLYVGKGKLMRWHSPDYIIKHIIELKSRFPSLTYFDIRDDTFSLRPIEQIREFCEKYQTQVKMRFKCLGDPHTIDDEKMKLLADAGCTDIIIGIQGAERTNLEVYKRNQRDDVVINAANILHKYKDKITVMYDVITCNPYENAQDIINLIRLLQKIPKPYYLSVNNLVFFTGSELYSRAMAEGVIKTEKDSAVELNYWDRAKHINLKKKNMYLVLILNLMRGSVTSNRFGVMPNALINFLLKEGVVRFNLEYAGLTRLAVSIVQVADFVREKIAKPVYHTMPTSFKVWYDKVRYRF